MSKPIFTWFPDIDAQEDTAPSVNVTKFGDGYEVRVPIGINSKPMKWSLVFTRTRAVGLAIRDFLRARGATETFIWTNPLNEQGTYLCRQWKVQPRKGMIVVTCEFEQVFEY